MTPPSSVATPWQDFISHDSINRGLQLQNHSHLRRLNLDCPGRDVGTARRSLEGRVDARARMAAFPRAQRAEAQIGPGSVGLQLRPDAQHPEKANITVSAPTIGGGLHLISAILGNPDHLLSGDDLHADHPAKPESADATAPGRSPRRGRSSYRDRRPRSGHPAPKRQFASRRMPAPA